MAMPASSHPLSLSGAETWEDLVAKRCGLAFGPTRRRRLDQALEERMRQTGLEGEDYWNLLQRETHSQEWYRLLQELVIGETSFFRHQPSFRYLEQEILPALISRQTSSDSPLAVLSAGCSTGAEVFSLAISIDRCAKTSRRPAIITGCDILPAAVATAEEGQFSRRQLRGLTSLEMETYFQFNSANGLYEPIARLQQLVAFKVGNILDPQPTFGGPFDLIFCQNLLIYFSQNHRQVALTHFANQLKPGGFLVLGPAEVFFAEDPRLQKLQVHQALVFQRSEIPSQLQKGAS